VHALLCRMRSNLAIGAGQLPSSDPARECSHA
jgi:hypothetical protein